MRAYQEIAKIYNPLSGNDEINRHFLVDLLAVSNTVRTYNREDIVRDYKFMKDFDCRKAPIQRSL